MSNQNKTIDELLKELGEANKRTGFQARKLESDENGNLLLDPNNPQDVEWFENNSAYDIIQNGLLIDQQGNMISKDKNTDVIY